MRAIRIAEPSSDPDRLLFELADLPQPKISDHECLIAVHGSGVNMSDVKGIMGVMPNLVWPRTPGRDYAGIVVEGPEDLVGKKVWGSGGDLGMARDGAHADYIIVNTDTVTQMPANLSMAQAAATGVPFCTAHVGLVEYARIQPGETVVVFGANGSVGKAVLQTALMHKARVIAVIRSPDPFLETIASKIEIINVAGLDVVETMKARIGDNQADIAFNTVGSPYFQAALNTLSEKGRQVIINAVEPKEVPFNLFEFYRKQLRLFGMASMSHNAFELGRVLEQLRPRFEAGDLLPFTIRDDHMFGLDNIAEAYRLVISGETRDRVVVSPRSAPAG